MRKLVTRSPLTLNHARRRSSVVARALLSEWKRLALPVKDAGLIVGVSGGADSVALILALKELLDSGRISLKVTIAHLDHGIRAAGKDDAIWVEQLGANLGFDVALGAVSVTSCATEKRDNLEQAARKARYKFLADVATNRGAGLIATAHTMDDQAETVLLHLLRGSGAVGLAGIDPVRNIPKNSDLLLVRPFINWAGRADTEAFCQEHSIAFRTDEMNAQRRFARVRLRKDVIPLLQTFNPKLVQALARTARLLRDDSVTLEKEATKLLDAAKQQVEGEHTSENRPVRVDILSQAPPSLRRRALRLWIAGARGDLRRLEFVHILGVEKLLEGERGGRTALLPGGGKVRRIRGLLHLLTE